MPATPTLESLANLTSSLPATPERNRYQAFVSTGLQDLVCGICLETLSFPLAFPCQRHYACHKCVHRMVDANKRIVASSRQPEIEPTVEYPISCPLCRTPPLTTMIRTDHMLKQHLMPPTSVLLALVQLVSGMQSHLPTHQRLRLPLIDDLSCPYCDKAFHPRGSIVERYEHLAVCPERKFQCVRCTTLVSATDLHRHLMEVCPSFSCMQCHQRGLVWRSLQEHEHREIDANVACRLMGTNYNNASHYACVSHNQDWLEVPKVVNLTCDLAVKHRRSAPRIEQLLLEFHKIERVLERMGKKWAEEDARNHARSNSPDQPSADS